jgi:hypothetical protein
MRAFLLSPERKRLSLDNGDSFSRLHPKTGGKNHEKDERRSVLSSIGRCCHEQFRFCAAGQERLQGSSALYPHAEYLNL